MIIKEIFSFIFEFYEEELPTEDIWNFDYSHINGMFYTFESKHKNMYINHENYRFSIRYDLDNRLFWIKSYDFILNNTHEFKINDKKLSSYIDLNYEFVDIENYMDFNDVDKLTEEEILYLSLKYDRLGEYFV